MAELEAKRQPVLPELALHITPLHVSISGRVPLEEPVTLTTSSTGTAAAADTLAAGKLAVAADLLKLPARQWRPVFAPSFTITGTQPVLVLPQVGAGWEGCWGRGALGKGGGTGLKGCSRCAGWLAETEGERGCTAGW